MTPRSQAWTARTTSSGSATARGVAEPAIQSEITLMRARNWPSASTEARMTKILACGARPGLPPAREGGGARPGEGRGVRGGQRAVGAKGGVEEARAPLGNPGVVWGAGSSQTPPAGGGQNTVAQTPPPPPPQRRAEVR